MSTKELTQRANALLKRNGCRRDGRPSKSVPHEQTQFERSVWHNKCMGKSRRN